MTPHDIIVYKKTLELAKELRVRFEPNSNEIRMYDSSGATLGYFENVMNCFMFLLGMSFERLKKKK